MLKSTAKLFNVTSMMKFATNFKPLLHLRQSSFPLEPESGFPYNAPRGSYDEDLYQESQIQPSFGFELDPKTLKDTTIRHQIYQ